MTATLKSTQTFLLEAELALDHLDRMLEQLDGQATALRADRDKLAQRIQDARAQVGEPPASA